MEDLINILDMLEEGQPDNIQYDDGSDQYFSREVWKEHGNCLKTKNISVFNLWLIEVIGYCIYSTLYIILLKKFKNPVGKNTQILIFAILIIKMIFIVTIGITHFAIERHLTLEFDIR